MPMTFRRLRLPALIAAGAMVLPVTGCASSHATSGPAGPRQWWDASWAEAPRLAWRTISARARPAARRDALALLESMREDDGTLLRRIQIGYATARTDGTPP